MSTSYRARHGNVYPVGSPGPGPLSRAGRRRPGVELLNVDVVGTKRHVKTTDFDGSTFGPVPHLEPILSGPFPHLEPYS